MNAEELFKQWWNSNSNDWHWKYCYEDKPIKSAFLEAHRLGREEGLEEAAKILDSRHDYYQSIALKNELNTEHPFYEADQMCQQDAEAIREKLK